MKQPGILRGWKEIAAELRISVKWAQECEARFGLPVYRLPGGRTVFLALRDLANWKVQMSEEHVRKLTPP